MPDRVKSAGSKVRGVQGSEGAPTSTERRPLPLGAGAGMNARVVLAAFALWTAKDFLPALIWATILAIALWPLYITFAARFPQALPACPPSSSLS